MRLIDLALPGRLAWPPKGWLALLRKQPALSMAGAAPATVPAQLLRRLVEVNRAVNLARVYRREAGDDWANEEEREVLALDGKRRIVKASDCEEYALEKLRRLLKEGVPRGALRLTLARTPLGETHLVLWAVAPDGSGRVLDSRVAGVRRPRDSDLAFERQELPGRWWWCDMTKGGRDG